MGSKHGSRSGIAFFHFTIGASPLAVCVAWVPQGTRKISISDRHAGYRVSASKSS